MSGGESNHPKYRNGERVGISVGSTVGVGVGIGLGVTVGVGFGVGDDEGVGVGTAVGGAGEGGSGVSVGRGLVAAKEDSGVGERGACSGAKLGRDSQAADNTIARNDNVIGR